MTLHKTIGELRSAMTCPEYERWMTFIRLFGLGPDREDHRAGVIAAVIANSQRSPNVDPYRPADFFPRHEPEPTEAELDEQIDAMFTIEHARLENAPQ